MKKIIASVMAATTVLTAAVSANAESVDEKSTESLSTNFTYVLENDPTYTVSIPSAVTITEDGADVTISAENVANLGDKKVSVTIAGTDYYRNQMVLKGKTESGPQASIRYKFELSDGSVIETTGGKDQVNGVELASFKDNGSVSFKAFPVLNGSSSIRKGVTYTGSITYGIQLVEDN